jgi:hypothetical protein
MQGIATGSRHPASTHPVGSSFMCAIAGSISSAAQPTPLLPVERPMSSIKQLACFKLIAQYMPVTSYGLPGKVRAPTTRPLRYVIGRLAFTPRSYG